MGDLITTAVKPAGIKRQHSAEFKTNVVLELLRGDKTISQIAANTASTQPNVEDGKIMYCRLSNKALTAKP